MRYKLLIADLDDTLTPNLGMPPRKFVASVRLQKAIHQVGERIAFSLCTGRDLATVLDVVRTLRLRSPQIIEGGAKIIDFTGKQLWAQYLSTGDVGEILRVLRDTKNPFSVIAGGVERMNEIPKIDLASISAVLWYDLSSHQVEDLRRRASQCRSVTLAVNTDRTGNTVHLTHSEGTKAYGIRKLIDLLAVDPKEVIGVGLAMGETT